MTGKLICTYLSKIAKVTDPTPYKFIVTRTLEQPSYWKNLGWYWARDLGPSPSLFKEVQILKKQGIWGPEKFNSLYRPQYLNQLRNNESTAVLFDSLIDHIKEGNTIAISCYCSSHCRCHLSLIVEEAKSRMAFDLEILQNA